MHWKCHKINLQRGGSYIDSLDWVKTKNEKAKMNSLNDDDKCFQCTSKVTLNHEEFVKKVCEEYQELSFL